MQGSQEATDCPAQLVENVELEPLLPPSPRGVPPGALGTPGAIQCSAGHGACPHARLAVLSKNRSAWPVWGTRRQKVPWGGWSCTQAPTGV